MGKPTFTFGLICPRCQMNMPTENGAEATIARDHVARVELYKRGLGPEPACERLAALYYL